ncbi:B2 bradykinin receptor-like [Bolinopsis microptera]|uniref:B2 bradykinin receptor-like n=1 Tax=Bolinopsis microptera TaxID=2820187 RepID=UPI003078F914
MNVFGLTALSITALISVHRLLRCTLPQAIARVTRNSMLIFVLGCYLAAISIAVLVMIIPPKLTYRYDNGYYSCIGHYGIKDRENNMGGIARAVGMTLGALFFLVIILINVLLHHYSRKKLAHLSGNSVKKHKTSRYRTLTTHSISALLIVTWLPFAITFFITISLESRDPGLSAECQTPSVRHISTFAINFYLLNFVLNPLLYSVTNINFMKFVIKLIKKHFSKMLCVAQLCTKLNPDLDISTNVSTMDQAGGASSNNCPAPERVYSNMLTVPAQSSTKKKLSPAKSANKYVKKESGGKKVVGSKTDEIRSNKSDFSEIIQMSPVNNSSLDSRKSKKKKDIAKKNTDNKKAAV